MKQRVSILRALSADYDILFLDEPFKGLDLETKLLTIDYLRKHTCGKTVLYITHDQKETELMKADTIINL